MIKIVIVTCPYCIEKMIHREKARFGISHERNHSYCPYCGKYFIIGSNEYKIEEVKTEW